MSSSEAAVGSLHEEKSWRRFVDPLVLFMLGAFAVTQPLLSDFRAGAGYFVARRNEPIDIVLLVVVLTVVPGLIANLIVWAADGFSHAARRIAQSTFVGIFVALISHTTLVRITSITWVVLLVASALIGVLAGLVYGRSKWFKTFLTYLIPAPLIFAVFFLATPPVSGLVFPSGGTGVESGVVSDTPVVFVVFDEFPVVSLLNAQGGIDATRFPNFAALASMSTWYKYTAAAHENTFWAVPALLSGESPSGVRLPNTSGYPGNLFTLLQASHEMHVVEPFTELCPPDVCESGAIPRSLGSRFPALLLDSLKLYAMALTPDPTDSPSVVDPFDEFVDRANDLVDQESESDQAVRFAQFLDGIGPAGASLHFMHLFLPHAPFRYYPSGSVYNNGGELDGLESDVWKDAVLADQALQRHLLQVQVVDRMIGDLLTRLTELGVLDEAIVVVTADHGASFQEGSPRRAVTDINAYEIGLVPLFIKGPNQKQGEIATTPARTVDVLPTVMEFLGREVPWSHDGVSLLSNARDVSHPTMLSGTNEHVHLDDVQRGVRDAVARIDTVFGGQPGTLDLFSFGEYHPLVGSTPRGHVNGASGFTARIVEAWRFAHVAPYLGLLPGFLHGEVQGDEVGADLHIAVAVNGEIATIVPVFSAGGGSARFNAIVPEKSFVSGFNDLQVFAVVGSATEPILRSIEFAGAARFEAERASSGRVTRVVGSNGEFWPVHEDSTITGYVDAAAWQDSEFQVSSMRDLYLPGWAVDAKGPFPVEQVVFFVNGVFAGSAVPDRDRLDIEDAFGTEDVRVSGFVGRLSQFLPSDNMEIRAFGLSNGLAEELVVTDSALSVISSG